MTLDLRNFNVKDLRDLIADAEQHGYRSAVHQVREAAEELWTAARSQPGAPGEIREEDRQRLQEVIEHFAPPGAIEKIRTNAGGEEPFPNTVIHVHLDGSMRKYIPVDGEELATLLKRAEQDILDKVVAWVRRDFSRNKSAMGFADAVEKREFEVNP